ncbi:MAG: hypothetical protein ONB12_10175 [candidate division KSB1 bacterium]|nr:hypothetical protein [candidate division KSB1 bacterium]
MNQGAGSKMMEKAEKHGALKRKYQKPEIFYLGDLPEGNGQCTIGTYYSLPACKIGPYVGIPSCSY